MREIFKYQKGKDFYRNALEYFEYDPQDYEKDIEEDDMLEGFESPKVYSESEISAGTDLGTDIGKTAAGDPRGAGHDKHIMEEEETEEK
jgi:hypothetical protein